MKKSSIFKILIGSVVILILFVAYKLLWTTIQPKLENRIDQIGLTPNEKAANGPIPGDVSKYEEEWDCCQNLPMPGYLKGLNTAEIANGERSGVFPCASFTGSFTGPNEVFAWRSQDTFEDCTYINNRKPGELYIVGGCFPPLEGVVPSGPYIAKADATTGKEIWRTYLENANVSGRWIGTPNLNFHENGLIIFSWQNRIIQLDPNSGLILKLNTIPNGPALAKDVNFKHLTIAPDGTVIVKNQNRPTGSKLQGTMAIVDGIQKGLKQANSNLVAVDPNTLEILDEIALEESSSVPHVITMYNGKTAIYIGANKKLYRYFWDPKAKKLSKDSWEVVAMAKGQTTAAAPSIIGDWIVAQTNGVGSETIASSIVVAHKDDPTRTNVIFPFGDLKKGEFSFCMPKPITDPENGMIYSADMGVAKVAGIKLDQKTGSLKLQFVVNNMTTTFQPLIGPKDKRVLLLTNMKPNVKSESNKLAFFTANYKEQLTWRNAATGKILAESDFFEPLVPNSLTTPGYGGRVYFPTKKGFIVMQVMPKK
jgi:hypothetical protein